MCKMPYRGIIRATGKAGAILRSREARAAAAAARTAYQMYKRGRASVGPVSLGYRAAGVVTRSRTRGIRQTIMRMKETHFVDYNWSKHELYHNQWLTAWKPKLNGTYHLPSQGDGDSQRTGNDIYARGIQLKMMFGCKQDRHNTTFRVLALKVTKGYDITNYSQVFDNQTGNVMLDGVDKDRVTVLFDKKVHYKPINPSPDGKEITIFRKYWIPHKTLYKFYDDGEQNNSYPYDIYVTVMAYDAYGSLGTDNIAYVQAWSRFYFKDK